MLSKYQKLVLVILVILGIGGAGYWGYCSYRGSCPALLPMLPINSHTGNISDTVSLTAQQIQQFRAQNIALFKEKKIKYLHNTIVEGHVLDGLDLKKLKPYTEDPAKYDKLAEKYGAQIRAGHVAPNTVRFVNDHVGYGVFAEAPIKVDDLVGEYTGIIQDKAFVRDTTYSWVYPVKENSAGETVAISLDSKYEGNEMRYVNHAKNPNTVKINVPVDNVWHECYVAVKAIPAGKQITVSYGDRYWQSRGKDPEDFD